MNDDFIKGVRSYDDALKHNDFSRCDGGFLQATDSKLIEHFSKIKIQPIQEESDRSSSDEELGNEASHEEANLSSIRKEKYNANVEDEDYTIYKQDVDHFIKEIEDAQNGDNPAKVKLVFRDFMHFA